MRTIGWAGVLGTAGLWLQAQSGGPPGVRFEADQAEAALAILEVLRRGQVPGPALWARHFATGGYRRLLAREAAMGRPLTESAFRAYLADPVTMARAAELAVTVARWKLGNLSAALGRAREYLPAGTPIRATVYFLIKPAPNSFVFEPATNPAIMLFVDSAVTPAKLENTVAHELHHIGYATACRDTPEGADTPARQVRFWMGAFGEGLAMLAAAGGPDAHPHAVSDSAERAAWDREVGNERAAVALLERFFREVLEGRLVGRDSIRSRAMGFFGVQGPWYTVGWRMAREIEARDGRPVLLSLMCRPAALLARYNEIALDRTSGGRLPAWSPEVVEAILRSP